MSSLRVRYAKSALGGCLSSSRLPRHYAGSGFAGAVGLLVVLFLENLILSLDGLRSPAQPVGEVAELTAAKEATVIPRLVASSLLFLPCLALGRGNRGHYQSSRAVAAGLGTLSDGYVSTEVILIEQVPRKIIVKFGSTVDCLIFNPIKTISYTNYITQIYSHAIVAYPGMG